MTDQFKYLRLSLRYIHGARSTTLFSYPAGEKPLRPSIDAPDILSHFVGLNDFYVTSCREEQRFYTFISIDESDGPSTRLEFTLSTHEDVLLSGRSILNLLNSVKDMMDKEESFTDTTVEAALRASGFSTAPFKGSHKSVSEDGKAGTSWRQYQSTADLASILSFPSQDAYRPYSEVVFAGPMAMPVGDNPLPQITVPLVQALTVVCPAGVSTKQKTVELTDKLTLTYTREYFEPSTETFEVGTTNRFVKIAGPALLVNNADKAGITFIQKVPFRVVSSKGKPIATYTILINGRTATRSDGVFEVISNDFNAEGTVTITVSSTNYFTTTLQLTAADMAKESPLEIVLVAEEMQVVLRLDFGQGRMIQQELLLEKNSPEYRQLRAGSFHGFRAHRMMGHDPETYSVEMASPVVQTAAPRTVADIYSAGAESASKGSENETPHTPAADTTVAPAKAEESVAKSETLVERPKSAAEIRAERLRADIPTKPEEQPAPEKKKRKKAYADDIPRKIDILEDDPDDPDDSESGSSKSRAAVSLIFLAAITVVLITAGIVWYLFTLLPSDADGTAEAQQGVDVTENVAPADADRINVVDDTTPQGTSAESAGQNAAGPTADEQADIAYLNANTEWRADALKSEKYRRFFASLSSGDIDAIATSDYFAVKGQATNAKAIKVVEYLWEAKGTFAEKRNVNALKELAGKESINVHDLYETLARMQDANPNKTPRPKK